MFLKMGLAPFIGLGCWGIRILKLSQEEELKQPRQNQREEGGYSTVQERKPSPEQTRILCFKNRQVLAISLDTKYQFKRPPHHHLLSSPDFFKSFYPGTVMFIACKSVTGERCKFNILKACDYLWALPPWVSKLKSSYGPLPPGKLDSPKLTASNYEGFHTVEPWQKAHSLN